MLKLLPIGTVVRLKGAEIPFMISGYFPEDEEKPGEYYDYFAFPYPLGFSSTVEASSIYADDIEDIIALGYQDKESMDYISKLESFQFDNDKEGGNDK